MKTGARFLALVLTVSCASGAAAQPYPLDSLFVAHRQPLALGESAMSGPGWDALLEDASRAQFVMIGESHNLLDIPVFTTRLFEALHERAGFNYLGLENGPFAMEQLSAPDVRGNEAASLALANRYVSALQFRNDQELDMIVAAGRLSTAKSDPVWGLDNEWGALHVFHRLADLAPTAQAKALLAPMIEEAEALEMYRPSEQRPRYINRSITVEDVDGLRRAFADSPEALRLLDDLRAAVDIYTMRTDRPSIYRSNHTREQYMRKRFMEEYRAAVAAGDTLPRVVLKFGQWHALRGVLNWGNVVPLGTFLSELAVAHGQNALFVWTGLVNEPGDVWTLHDTPEYVPIAKAGTTDGWWLIDLRPIRALAAAGQVADMNSEMQKVIFGFDYALLIGGGRRATHDRVLLPGSDR